jgi:HK97 family phage major capsid protein
MSKLVEKRNELDSIDQKINKVFEQAGEDLDFSRVTAVEGDSTKQKVEKLRRLEKERDDLNAEVEELAAVEKSRNQRMQHAGEGEENQKAQRPQKSFGELFTESDAFKNKGATGFIDGIGVKTLMETGAGWAPEDLRTGRVVEDAVRPIQVIDLLPSGTTNQSAVVYMEETTYTNAAQETAEAGTYQESTLQLTEQSSQVRKIAVFIPVTDEQLEDVEQAQTYVQNRLRFMLRQRLDNQIINGNGSAPNLTGVLNVSGLQSQAKGTDPIADAIHKAITKVRVTGQAMPSAVVMHPEDWESLRLTRTSDGIYIWGNPAETGQARVWGLPIVQAQVAPKGTAVVGDWQNFIELTERRGIEVQISNSHSDYFVNGKQAIRADFRVAMPIYRPAAFCEVTGL